MGSCLSSSTLKVPQLSMKTLKLVYHRYAYFLLKWNICDGFLGLKQYFNKIELIRSRQKYIKIGTCLSYRAPKGSWLSIKTLKVVFHRYVCSLLPCNICDNFLCIKQCFNKVELIWIRQKLKKNGHLPFRRAPIQPIWSLDINSG